MSAVHAGAARQAGRRPHSHYGVPRRRPPDRSEALLADRQRREVRAQARTGAAGRAAHRSL